MPDAHHLAAAIATLRKPGMTLAEASDRVQSAPGLYAFHAAALVWEQLGLGTPPDDRPLYVGKAEKDLVHRDVNEHFTGKTGWSTVRRSCAALLAEERGFVAVPRTLHNPGHFDKYSLTLEGETALSEWMRANLRLTV